MSMKYIACVFVSTILCLWAVGCGGRNVGATNGSRGENGAELKVGGIYAAKNENGKYTLTKILALDEFSAHVRFYKDEFDELPENVSSVDLTFSIGHAPMAREGFLSEESVLVATESVSDSELSGYRFYLEAMQGTDP